VTGVSVRSGPFDRMMNTLRVQVWSIGSTHPLDIAHVGRDEFDLPRLLLQLGIPLSPSLRELPTTFGPGVWLRSAPGIVFWTLLSLAATAALVVVTGEPLLSGVLLLPMTLGAGLYAFAERWTAAQHCAFHEHHVELRTGLWWREHVYARYDNVKKVEVTRFPSSDAGQLKLYVAGERVVQNDNKGNATPVPYSMSVARLADVRELGRWIDEVIAGRRGVVDTRAPSAAPPRMHAEPAVATVATRVALCGSERRRGVGRKLLV
jgi:membrane protein YdbS with pleckstrin-like domain